MDRQNKMTEEEKRHRIVQLETVINELEHNTAFNIVIEDKKRTIEFCDNAWHFLDVSNEEQLKKFLELKYAKHGAVNIINTIDIYKQELQSLKEEESDEQRGYVQDE